MAQYKMLYFSLFTSVLIRSYWTQLISVHILKIAGKEQAEQQEWFSNDSDALCTAHAYEPASVGAEAYIVCYARKNTLHQHQ